MRTELAVVAAFTILGCGGKKDEAKKDEPAKAVDSKTDKKADEKKPDEKKADEPPKCDLTGAYRLRFRSNGSDGWWLRLAVSSPTAAELKVKDQMDVLVNPLTFKSDGCKATITSKNEHSGDVKLELVEDPKTHTVTGTLARTLNGEKTPADTVPVAGRHDVTPNPAPACIKPGIYELAMPGAKWKLAEGDPRDGNCDTWSEPSAHALVRVEMLEDKLYIDEVSGDDKAQSFGRATLVKKSDCEYDFDFGVQDWSVKATIKLAADGTISGTAGESRYQHMEDGTAGENLWACKTEKAPFSGKRVGD